MAYRRADHERWQQLDFVVGIEVRLSGNHTIVGADGRAHRFTDICDTLAGRYPKDFVFTGWHPFCRCHAAPILKTDQELDRDIDDILDGNEPAEGSENEVTDLPDNFNQWVADNAERAKTHYSMPLFVSDNQKYISAEFIEAYGARKLYATLAEYEAAMRYNKKHANFSDEVNANIRYLNKVMPVMQGRIMDFKQADESRSNPNFSIVNSKELGHRDNCQTCTVCYELRRRGYDIEAKPSPFLGKNPGGDFYDFCDRHGLSWKDRFVNIDGTSVKYTRSGYDTINTFDGKVDFIERTTQETGRYEVYCQWKKRGAHVFIVERQGNGNLLWFDPQSGEWRCHRTLYAKRKTLQHGGLAHRR